MRGWGFVAISVLVALVSAGTEAGAEARGPLPVGCWTTDQSQPILDKTAQIRLDPDLSGLPAGERAAVARLLEAGRILHHLYENECHHDAARARRDLARWSRSQPASAQTRNLVELYALFTGPVATTLDNQRHAFLPVDSLVPGKSFYPWGVNKQTLDGFMAGESAHTAELLGVRSVVRRADAATLRADLATFSRHRVLDVLHPGLSDRLRALARAPDAETFYAVPYAVAHGDSLLRVYHLLMDAAEHAEPTDRAFARYLRLRARDLITNDYEAGDAIWVTSRFGRLNAQIGAYETYDDELYGVKAAHSMSLLLTDTTRTRQVRDAIRGLQDMEDALPYPSHKKVKEDIPIGVYDVIADFGQARGTNTASILPNDSDLSRRYGRIILMRRNILTHPALVAEGKRAVEAVLSREHHGDFDPEGTFQRVLWHEIGHYLGPDRTREGRELDQALEEESGTLEEMKSDLVSLFVGPELRRRGYYDDAGVRALYASGVMRMLQKTRPRSDQVYGTMQLMQLNWFLDRGALIYDAGPRRLSIRYDRYHDAVRTLIEQVLAIQHAGSLDAAREFIARWTTWDERHESLAAALRAAETSRFRRVRYAALGE